MVIDKKSNAIAVEILTQKVMQYIVIMHEFCEKSNAIVMQ